MKNTKRASVCYTAWEADKEAAMLNEQSKNGWQLKKSSIFGSTLVKDDSVRYIYQIDRKREPDERYYETFSEQGWEYVTNLNGWQYFRKKYDPALPKEEYEIYTDDQTYADSLRKDIRLNTTFGIAYALLAAVYTLCAVFDSYLMWKIFAVTFLIYTAVFFLTANQLRKKISGKKTNISGKTVMCVQLSAMLIVLATVGFMLVA